MAKFLVYVMPQFLQSRKEVKLLGLIRGNWAIGGGWGECQVGERGERC